MFFSDLTRIQKAADFLPLVTAAIVVDLIVMGLLLAGAFESRTLTQWYNNYGLGAVLSDVFIIVIGVIIAIAIYPFLFSKFNIVCFVGLAIGVQLIHDILFALFFNGLPKGQSRIFDTFKDYAREIGIIILAADAAMIACTALLASLLASLGERINTILVIVAAYLVPYFLGSMPMKKCLRFDPLC
jgi:hypothetical protein